MSLKVLKTAEELFKSCLIINFLKKIQVTLIV